MAEEGEGEVAGADQRGRTMRSLTRTVRHRSPMRACARCACTRLATADLALPVRQNGSRSGNFATSQHASANIAADFVAKREFQV
jgi:hypothetical protein